MKNIKTENFLSIATPNTTVYFSIMYFYFFSSLIPPLRLQRTFQSTTFEQLCRLTSDVGALLQLSKALYALMMDYCNVTKKMVNNCVFVRRSNPKDPDSLVISIKRILVFKERPSVKSAMCCKINGVNSFPVIPFSDAAFRAFCMADSIVSSTQIKSISIQLVNTLFKQNNKSNIYKEYLNMGNILN